MAGLVGFVVFALLAPQNRPQHAAPLPLERSDILERARGYLEQRGLDPGAYTAANAALLYSNRALHFFAASNSMRTDPLAAIEEFVPPVYWRVRLADPARGDEFSMKLTPSGRFVEVTYTLPDSIAGASLTQEAAQALAQRAMATRLATRLDGFTLVDAQQYRREARTDHTFTWQRDAFEVPGTRLRLSVTVQGDAVSGWVYEAQLPGTFVAAYNTDVEVRQALGAAQAILVNFAWLLALLVFALRFRSGEIGLRTGLIVAGLGLACYALVNTNALPYLRFVLTDDTAPGFSSYLFVIFGAIFVPMALFFTWLSGESLTRETWPDKLRTIDGLLAGRLFFPGLGAGLVHGFFIGGLLIGLVELSLWIVARFPSVIILSTDYQDQLFSAFVPYGFSEVVGVYTMIFVIAYAVLFVFGSLRRLMRRTVPAFLIALAVSLLLWDSTEVSPAWLSPLLGLAPMGVLLALYLRYDLLTAAVATFVLTAGGTATLYLMEPATTYTLAGALSWVVLLGLPLAGLAMLRYGTPIDEQAVQPAYARHITERERLKMELDIARRAQLRMLPREIPRLHGLDIAAFSEPAREVGGDYFDFFQLGPGQLGIAVGDVSGKGMPAALYMTLLKGYLQSRTESTVSPREVLSHVNRAFYQSAEANMFVTLFYGIVTLEPGSLRFARAGHNPVVLFRKADNATLLLRPPGIGIGLEGGTVFDRVTQEECVPLYPGDVLVIYTDGLVEARNERMEEFGEARLLDLVRVIHDGTAEQVLQRIRADYAAFVGSQDVHDDLTCLVVKLA